MASLRRRGEETFEEQVLMPISISFVLKEDLVSCLLKGDGQRP